MNKDVVYILSIYIYSCTHTMEYYSVIEMNEILPFAATWLHLEGAVQGKIRQTEKNKYHMILLIYGILKRQKQGCRYREQISGFLKQKVGSRQNE